MNIIFSIISIYFIFMQVETLTHNLTKRSSSDESDSSHGASCSSGNKHLSLPLDNVKLKIISDSHVVAQVNLKRTERVLANKNLPVWILNGDELIQDTEVMERLGEFTIYHEPETSTAAVYFHKRREFDGMINYDIQIDKLSIDSIKPRKETIRKLNQFGIYRRVEYNGHEMGIVSEIEDPDIGVNYQNYWTTYNDNTYDGYPEVLVIVSWDVARNLIKFPDKSNWYTEIVSYVITLFNSVDMLYSKLKNTNIQINIAGIIIGTKMESFAFLKDCYNEFTHQTGDGSKINVKCAILKLTEYLTSHKQIIPPDSYDAVVFLTRDKLMIKTENSNGENANKNENNPKRRKNNENSKDEMQYEFMIGLSQSFFDLYVHKLHNLHAIPLSVVMDDGYLKNYIVVAHELAHLMTVKHDPPSCFTHDKKCCGNIMKPEGEYWCNNCLSWSETSEKTFNLFFTSPNCCGFINKPRSLYPLGLRKILSSDEQCQCYGFPSALWFEGMNENYCNVEIPCRHNEKNEFYRTVIPMDGTPCGNNKVCWGRICQDVAMSQYSDDHENEL